MNLKEFYKMRRNHEQELRAELVRVQAKGGEMNFQYADRLDFGRTAYWFQLEIDSAYGRIYHYCFACDSLANLKNAITWVVNDTRFYEVTAFVKDSSYVTFRSQQDIEMTFGSYYGNSFRFTEDSREPYPELTEATHRSGQSTAYGEEFLLKGNADCFAIYQIDCDSAGRDYRFFGMKYLDKQRLKPNGTDYNLVYAASLSKTETRSGKEILEEIYVRFNADLPEDYEGHSLSVSDVVLVNQNGRASAWYVDSVGFRELPEFVRERQDVVDLSRKAESKVAESVAAQNPPQEKKEQQKTHRGR